MRESGGDRGFAMQNIGRRGRALRANRGQHISCFRCPGSVVRRIVVLATRRRGSHTYIAQKRSATPRVESLLATSESMSCGVVDLADGTRRRRKHAE